MSEYAYAGSELTGSREYLDPNSTYMENGKYYEATYNVGGIQPIYDPDWREVAILKAQEAVEKTPGCYLNYAYVEPNGQVRVQWLYDYNAYAYSEGMVPTAFPVVLAAIVVIAVAVAITAIFLYLTVSQFAIISPESADAIKWIGIGIAAIAGAIAVYFVVKTIDRWRQ
jgi:hypothetical protein